MDLPHHNGALPNVGRPFRWGFPLQMMVCLSDHTFKDSALRHGSFLGAASGSFAPSSSARKMADETTKMLYGGEDGMWGMEDA